MSRTTFKALRDPLLNFVLGMLKKQHSIQQLMISQQINEADVAIICSNGIWAPFINDIICEIKECLPTTKGQIIKHFEKKVSHIIRKLNGSESNILLNSKKIC